MGELIEAGKKYEELKNLCVWNKTNGGMGSLYRSKHELVFVFKNGKSPHINNIELGKNGRYRTNVWDYAGVNTLQNQDQLEMHPTVKPVSMIKDAILDCTHRNDLVLDCFGGSGSTLIAAEKAGRRALLIEIDPKYVDVTIKRFQNLTKKQVIHAVTGTIFEDVKEG
jgi:DNA modification methylase